MGDQRKEREANTTQNRDEDGSCHLPSMADQTDLEAITLSEVGQRKTITYEIAYTWDLKKKKIGSSHCGSGFTNTTCVHEGASFTG